ncbi:hypothetical protein [Gordonia bronchialis]|uniref:hypothetical protein n=1 Tax=Gordonia bronchialis TaxID=2054 RepID=UPI00226FA5F5|nr:hypothetical protein [Gordonia bronchialis]
MRFIDRFKISLALVGYLLGLVGFALLGLNVYLAAWGAGMGTLTLLGAACAVAYGGALLSFRAQVRQSPRHGPGTALLAATTPRAEAQAQEFVEEDRRLHAA